MTLMLQSAASDHAARVVFDNVSWRFYEQLLEEIGDGNTRVTFDRGRMEVMSPLGEHERYKKRFARLVELMMLELDIDCACYGSTTYKAEELQRGLEPDECYYIGNVAAAVNKDRFDLSVDPPPDLVLEMDITHRAIDRESIYAAMGVPEIWRYDGEKLECLLLNEKQAYVVSERSRSFPFLKPADLLPFANRQPENAMLREFKQWVKTLPR